VRSLLPVDSNSPNNTMLSDDYRRNTDYINIARINYSDTNNNLIYEHVYSQEAEYIKILKVTIKYNNSNNSNNTIHVKIKLKQ